MPSLRPSIARVPSLLLGVWLFVGWSPGARAADDLTRPIRGEVASGAPIQFLGANSCSANSCHNRGNFRGASELSLYEPKPSWEHAYWQRFDPHVRAFAVLETERSRRIEQLLRGLDSSAAARPERDGLCLSCHVHQNFSNAGHGPEFSLADGVSCESCHGASQLWNAVHYQAGWDALSAEQKASYGFVPLESVADRARSCSACHVGSTYEDPVHGIVDVNHDLIAAGHPRLNFEFASYHAQYPKHWVDVSERAADPAFEARAWVIGQLVTAESSLRLLKARASRSKVEATDRLPRAIRPASDDGPHAGPWPEFAEYNCYACHHDLRGGVPLGVGIASAAPGQLPWGTWYTPMSDAIARAMPPAGRDWPSLLSAIEAEMIQPLPGADRVERKVDEAIAVVDDWISELRHRPIDLETIDRLMEAAVDHLRESSDPTWDRNAQAYLALAALHAARSDVDPALRDPAVAEALDAMLGRLQFRSDTDSPPEYRVESLDGLLSTIRPRAANEE